MDELDGRSHGLEGPSRGLRALVRRSATIPCLALIGSKPSTQDEAIDSLAGVFAAKTVADSINQLAEAGLVQPRRAGRLARGVEYHLTPDRQKVLGLSLQEFGVVISEERGQ